MHRSALLSTTTLQRPVISVALATFNGSAFIEEQLRSVERQTLRPDEVIVVDDASTDSTFDMVMEFAQRAPFAVQVSRNPVNRGYRAAFEAALAKARGDLVFLCDQDDVWHEGKIETVAGVFRSRKNTALVIHDLNICTEDLRRTGKTKVQREREARGSSRMYVTGMASAVRKELLRVALPFPTSDIPHDDWLHTLAAVLGLRYVLPTPLAEFRRHTRNVTKESVLNDPRRISRFGFMLRLARTDSSDSILRRTWALDEAFKRIRSMRSELIECGIVSPDGVQDAEELALKRLELVQRRLALRRVRRPARFAQIAALLMDNGYQEFSGLRTALKDALSP